MGVLGRLLNGAWRLVSKMLGRGFHEWSTWASENPVPAAFELDTIATVLEGRADAFRRKDGWRARRDRSIASSLREQARRLRSALDADEVRAACAVVPGTRKRAP